MELPVAARAARLAAVRVLRDRSYLHLIASMDERGRTGRLDRRERLQELVRVRGPLRDDPGVAGFEQDRLPFELQFGPSFENVADGFVIASSLGLGLAG